MMFMLAILIVFGVLVVLGSYYNLGPPADKYWSQKIAAIKKEKESHED